MNYPSRCTYEILSRTKSNYWLEQNLFHLFKNIPRTLVHWSYIYWFALCSWKICITQFQKSNAKFFNRTYTVCYVMLNKKVVLLHHKKVKRIIFSHKTRQVTYFNLRHFKIAKHTRIRKTYFRPWFKLHNCILRHEGKLQYNEYK